MKRPLLTILLTASALTLVAILLLPGRRRADDGRLPGLADFATEAEPPTWSPCPGPQRVVDLPAGSDPAAFIAAVTVDSTLVRLAADLTLDFSALPAESLPITLGYCVTLTSVTSFTADGAPEARSPSARGPRLSAGPHRPDEDIFLQVDCAIRPARNAQVLISGFQLIGPGDETTGDIGIKLRGCGDVHIRNLEVTGWGGSGVNVDGGSGADPETTTGPGQVHVSRSYFHHNEHPSSGGHAAGYGVSVGVDSWALIYENVFDVNRHAIAGKSTSGGYKAERNLVLKGSGEHAWYWRYTHQFDVHGTGCWWSSDKCGNAGQAYLYRANAFQFRNDNAIKIRGKPGREVRIEGNVFPHPGLEDDWGDDAVHLYTTDNVVLGPGNIIKHDSYGRYAVCDFDGDEIDDLFLATGVSWWFASYGELHWSYLNERREQLDQLRFGYFDDDLRCDILAEADGEWRYLSGGQGNWISLGRYDTPLDSAAFGRFDPSHRDHRPGRTRQTTHAFRRDSTGQWSVTPLTGPAWQPVQSSSFPFKQLRFGDFTGDGVTDVLAVVGGRWAISESATGSWQRLNPTLGDPVADLFIANMDPDDNIDDILWLENKSERLDSSIPRQRTTVTWWRSRNGVEPWHVYTRHVFEFFLTGEMVPVGFGFAGRFGVAPGGGTLTPDQHRVGHFFAHGESAVGATPTWTSVFQY